MMQMLICNNKILQSNIIHSSHSPFRGRILRPDQKWHKLFYQINYQKKRSQTFQNLNLTLRSQSKPLTGYYHRNHNSLNHTKRSLLHQRKTTIQEYSQNQHQITNHSINKNKNYSQKYHTISTTHNSKKKNSLLQRINNCTNYQLNQTIKTERDQNISKKDKYKDINGLYVIQQERRTNIMNLQSKQDRRKQSPNNNLRRGLRILKLKTKKKIKGNNSNRLYKQDQTNNAQISSESEKKLEKINKEFNLKNLLKGRSIQPFLQSFKQKNQKITQKA